MYTNRWRRGKLIKFIELFRKEGLLQIKDYEYLYTRYTSILSFLEYFPNKDDYTALYQNKEFDTFVTNARKRLKYYAVVTVACWILLILLAITGQIN